MKSLKTKFYSYSVMDYIMKKISHNAIMTVYGDVTYSFNYNLITRISIGDGWVKIE